MINKQPELKEIDLSKSERCNHPDIKEKRYYLARINDKWYAGTFTKQWYGWNFDAVYDAGYQLDYGGLQELYEIAGRKAGRKSKSLKDKI